MVPINKTAAIVFGKSDNELSDIGRGDILELLEIIDRRRVKLKEKLGIKTRAQAANLRYKLNKGVPTARRIVCRDLVDELIQSGRAVEILKSRLTEIKAQENEQRASNKKSS